MKNVKTMWICCMVILGAAIMLILISVLSGTQIIPGVVEPVNKEESGFNQTIQQGLSKMSDAIDRLEEENKKDKQQLDELAIEMYNVKSIKKNYEDLLKVLVLIEEKNNEEAAELAAGIDYEKLSDSGKVLFDGVKEKLKL